MVLSFPYPQVAKQLFKTSNRIFRTFHVAHEFGKNFGGEEREERWGNGLAIQVYSTCTGPQMIPGPEMIPKLNCK